MSNERLYRRDFIKFLGITAAVPFFSACDKVINPTSVLTEPSTRTPEIMPSDVIEPSKTPTPTPTETPKPEPSDTSTSTPEDDRPIRVNDTIARYENLSQIELAGFLDRSKRLYYRGGKLLVLPDIGEPHGLEEETYPGLQTVHSYGVLLEKPQLETFILPNWDDSVDAMVRYDLYTAPVLYQTSNTSEINNFVAKVVFFGDGMLSSRGFFSDQILSSGPQQSTILTEELIGIVQPGVQHEFSVNYALEPGSFIEPIRSGGHGDAMKCFTSLSRVYGVSTSQIIQTVREGIKPEGIPTLIQCQTIILNQER